VPKASVALPKFFHALRGWGATPAPLGVAGIPVNGPFRVFGFLPILRVPGRWCPITSDQPWGLDLYDINDKRRGAYNMSYNSRNPGC